MPHNKPLSLQDLQVFQTSSSLIECLTTLRDDRLSIGFVPTMGALHDGHMSLIERSNEENDLTLCSIYVNPTQFNNKQDLDEYPRTLSEDIEKLQLADCNIIFTPNEQEVYPNGKNILDYNIGSMANVMEGFYRPGHFQGMVTIVKTLLEITQPEKAYFGEKDFQQLSIIRKLVKDFNLKVDIVGCPIIRERNGLAMSSRNERLDKEIRKKCNLIYDTLNDINSFKNKLTVKEMKTYVHEKINASGFLKIDYFEITDETTLNPISSWTSSKNIRGFIAVYCGDIRLIDNIKL